MKKEKSALNGCRPYGDGIWDLLGYYDPKKYEITICERHIEEHIRNLAKSIEYDELYTKFVLRELVRSHEHAHSLLHTGMKYLGRFKKGYRSLLPVVNEPITEFITWSIVQRFATKFFEKVFEDVDQSTPPYYREWKRIRQLIDSKNEDVPRSKYVYYVPGLIYVVRKGIWRDFDSFLKDLDHEWEAVKALFLVLIV
jgi:hypothetical protein